MFVISRNYFYLPLTYILLFINSSKLLLSYIDLLRRLVEVGRPDEEITKTMYWRWLVERDDFPEEFFNNTPPIGEAPESDRILIAGTNVETRDMYKILQGLETYQRVRNEIQNRYKMPAENISGIETLLKEHDQELIVSTDYLEKYDVQPEYVFSSRVGSFWEDFFGEKDFLDNLDKISIPSAIITTGYMRNRNKYGGQTLNVKERLKEIASAWDIPLKIIKSWAP